jgi:hypothetical protein
VTPPEVSESSAGWVERSPRGGGGGGGGRKCTGVGGQKVSEAPQMDIGNPGPG